jgi:hypothetical protein
MLRPSCFVYNISLENNLLRQILRDILPERQAKNGVYKLWPWFMLPWIGMLETKKHKTEQKLFPEIIMYLTAGECLFPT